MNIFENIPMSRPTYGAIYILSGTNARVYLLL